MWRCVGDEFSSMAIWGRRISTGHRYQFRSVNFGVFVREVCQIPYTERGGDVLLGVLLE